MLLPIWTSGFAQDIPASPSEGGETTRIIHLWKLVSDTDNIRLYRRPSHSSTVDEVRIEATFNTNMATFLDLIGDVNSYPEWVYKCTEAKTVGSTQENELVYYARTDFPWPLQDRDLVVRSRYTTDPASGIVTSTSTALPSSLPEKKGVVRITKFNSVWKIIPVADSIIRIDYHVVTDPGGKLPDWVVNLGVATGPRKTMEGLQRLLETANSNQALKSRGRTPGGKLFN